MYALYLLNFIFTFVMFIVANILKKKQYPKIGTNGYSTPSSRKSQTTWDYAQEIAPTTFMNVGKILLFITLVVTIYSMIFNKQEQSIIISTVIGVIGLFLAFIIVESKIETLFDNKGLIK